ncbi:MAG: cytochrome c biogenesis protein CcdA [Candidatus Krumholzibacteriia bacterium]
MEEIFAGLTRAVAGAPLVALAAALAWGVLSVVLSPCHLASIPLVVGFINGQGRLTTGRAFVLASIFALGVLVTIALVGAVTAAAGRMLGDVGALGNYVVAGVFFLVGLHLMDIIPAPWSGPGQTSMRRKGAAAAFLLGLIFGIALGPCTFAYMAPMLAVTFKIAATQLAFGLLLLLAYAVGHCGVIAVAGASAGRIQQYLDWDARARGTRVVKRICGALVCLAGVYLIYVAP